MISDTADIRIEEIMPRLHQTWPVIPFESSFLTERTSYRKLKKKEINPEGIIPVIDQGEEFITGYTDDKRDKYDGSLPVIIFGDHTRRIKYVNFEFAVGADGTKLFKPIPDIDPRFFYHYLSALKIESQGYSRHYKFLREIDFPLPPLNEQKRIVEKLEKLLGKVETAQERLDKIPIVLKRFRQSVLAAACSGKLTVDWRLENSAIESGKSVLTKIAQERLSSMKKKGKFPNAESEEPFQIPENWQFCLLDEIAAIKHHAIKAGPFGSSLTKSVYVPSGYKIYGQEQVIKKDPYFGDYYIDDAKFKELQSCEVQAGDILVSLVGTIGKTLIVPDDFEKGIINPRLVKFSLHSFIYNRYIEIYLNSTLAQNLLSNESHGGTMEILNLGILRKLPIPLPPHEEQKEIVRRVEDLFKFADQIEARYKKARSYTDKLTQSILAKAFRGELVPQDESDEPASVLLERIKAEKTENNADKNQTQRRRAVNQSNLFE